MGSRSISQLLKIYRATCKRPSEFEEDEEKIYEKKERLKLLWVQSPVTILIKWRSW
jgi:hypothetical protein